MSRKRAQYKVIVLESPDTDLTSISSNIITTNSQFRLMLRYVPYYIIGIVHQPTVKQFTQSS